jgi:hypothetical protein
MPLKGQAKTDYQRDYMRRRRAGEATARPRWKRPKLTESPPPRPKPRCSFCGEQKVPMASNDFFHICGDCAREAVAVIDTAAGPPSNKGS